MNDSSRPKRLAMVGGGSTTLLGAMAAALGFGSGYRDDVITITAPFERGATGYRVYKRAPTSKPRYFPRRKGGWIRLGRKFKGSSDAKRAARQAQVAAKAAGRPYRARKRAMATAHGLARDWFARWERGMPVSFTYRDAIESGGGSYVRASQLLLKRLGPAYRFVGSEERSVVQLQGPPCARRPLPTYPVA